MNRIDELLKKYWEAETSLAEEQELAQLLLNSEGYEQEKALFSSFSELKKIDSSHTYIPKAKVRKLNTTWISWAASLAILIGSFSAWRAYENHQAEKAAYEEVMRALALIQSNLSKGQEQMEPLNDLKYLNTTNQLFGNPITTD
jgi:type VI protein secretion system component VasF